MISVSAVIANTLRRQITGRRRGESHSRVETRLDRAPLSISRRTPLIDICPRMLNVTLYQITLKYDFLSLAYIVAPFIVYDILMPETQAYLY